MSPFSNRERQTKCNIWLKMSSFRKKNDVSAYFVEMDYEIRKKGKRKVQGVPQSQTVALPRPQEEEETDKSKQAQTEQTYEKH